MTSTPQAATRAEPPGNPTPPAIVQGRLRRRPSGEPPPLPRALNTSGKSWLVLAVGVLAFATLISLNRRAGGAVDVWDHRVLEQFASLRTSAGTRVMKWIGLLATGRALQVFWLVNLVIMVIWRRWRHLLIWVAVYLVVINIGELVVRTVARPRPMGIEILGPWKGFAMPSLPVAVLASFLVSALYANVPAGRLRSKGKIAAGAILAVVIISRLYLAQDAPTDALAGFVIGVAIPLAAFRFFAPNDIFPVTYRRGRAAHLDVSGQRYDAIVQALEEQLGLIAREVKPFGLEGSGGSTPLRVKVKGDPDVYVFCKLYANTHLRADRWYKLARTLMYGRLEDEKPYNAVRRLVQYEDYVLRLMYDAGLPVPRPYGIVEITPEREYLLVMEFMEGAVEIGEAEIDDSVIDQGLDVVRRMWRAGLAHRDIKPANLLVRDGRLHVIDSAFAEIRPSPWRQAVDLANMMLVLALRTDAARVYERAKAHFSEQEIAEAFASASAGFTMPSQLRRLLRSQGRDLHGDFTRLLPYELPRVKIQRWSIRRVGLTIAVGVIGLILLQIAATLMTSPL